MRIDYSAADLDPVAVYRLLTALVLPRPIAWVSTIDGDGVPNLAPHSFFTVASTDPGIVQFTATARKDTLRNVEATGEFVVNLAPRKLLTQVNATGTSFPHGTSEFAEAVVRPEASLTVAPPRVADSPAAIECGLERVVEVGNSFLVLGLVRHIAVAEEALNEKGRPDAAKLDPLARLGGNQWSALGEVFGVDRISLADWNQGRR
ncbi:flavin reductase family protein [Zafaria sp. Z1313]|uniref:flavin reductase family protein n=1 Tax=unclassified Zafaria TaxID=2828765 RepID=UPI002E783BB7|nr:flavin reductase family protein [Zafaria sp. J156]MEE1620995.1 flavin reductase family protein [Zafaria sp. J156]